MAGCRIVNSGVITARDAILKSSDSYKTAAEELISSLNTAISEMEGEAKDALKRFIDTDVKKFTVEDIPTALKGMSDLLEANRSNFEDVDMKLANSIGSNK